MSDQYGNMLSERLAQGPLPAAEAQLYAAALAEALRRLHDQGTIVGALEPSRIFLAGPTVKLTPGAVSKEVTPYTAPEQLQGKAADARSDIFAFGAIFQEMLTGRKAFTGATEEELRAAILEREPAPVPAEFSAYAKLMTKCLAKTPLQRFQRMQHVQMELKLHTVVARRNAQDTTANAERVQELVRTAVGELEGRMSARFEAQEERLRAAAAAEQTLRAEIAALEARLASRVEAGENRAADHDTRLAQANEAAGVVSERLAGIDQTLKRHSSSVESLESAIAQTDDLVERVVEALDSLERSVTEQNEMRFAAARN
jgi:hypothetical protein